MFQGGIRAHGGQAAIAGDIVTLPQLNAVFRGMTRAIRVWDGHGDAEEFTVEEARQLCARGDQALMLAHPGRRADADFMIDANDETLQCLTVPRQWLIAFLGAMRRALRTADTAQTLSTKPYCIDADSDPGAWDRHLRHTAPMRGVDADSS